MSSLPKVTIDRSKWCFGGPGHYLRGPSVLWNSKGMMCCLGFWCHQIKGIPHNQLFNRGMPNQLPPHIYKASVRESEWHRLAAEVNDSPALEPAAREDLIKKVFRRNGYDVEFIGEYTPEQLPNSSHTKSGRG